MNHFKNKQRIDLLLVEKNLAPTRSKAQALIMSGSVFVDDKSISKPGTLVSTEAKINLSSAPAFVSRGGEKLAGALIDFNLTPRGRICLDVGSSTGGFTDCLIQNGAEKVFSIDVGTHQMDSELKKNSKIVLMEQTHINDVTPGTLIPSPDFAVIDVSFISLTKILLTVKNLLKKPAVILAMVKPQFEVGPKNLKKGVVRDVDIQRGAVETVKNFSKDLGLDVKGESPARIKGPKGNQEYFLYLVLN